MPPKISSARAVVVGRRTAVKTVETANPPMMTNAIE